LFSNDQQEEAKISAPRPTRPEKNNARLGHSNRATEDRHGHRIMLPGTRVNPLYGSRCGRLCEGRRPIAGWRMRDFKRSADDPFKWK
jgi:hypothetical protein